ncbi:hypothetical protein OG520_40350 (plasmid) [Streptomyces sp. NBC_00984]|uniref:hypothetical protein n=1 Tax=Streptomyces sp. NBC_00984 TaxID=2903700 RepID=UPI002F919562|nr:hypothetical protein OG520_40350 [Streptomyces sp. NBC_00984]
MPHDRNGSSNNLGQVPTTASRLIHDIDANAAKGEPAHQHFDFRLAFYLTAEQPPALALQEEEVAGARWLPYADVRSPTLRAKLLDAEADGLDGRPEPVNASALIHDGAGRYLLHLRDDRESIWEPWVLALLGGYDKGLLMYQSRGEGMLEMQDVG